jgi:ferredoxin
MNTSIYYFSGTGNSYYVAKELQKRIQNSELIPIVGIINRNEIKCKSDTVGIIFPLQGPTFPNAVKQLLEKIDLTDTRYIFAIATRGGTTCRIREQINKVLKKKGKSLNSHFIITVFNNDPKIMNENNQVYEFHVPTDEEITNKKRQIDVRLDVIKDIIINKETRHEVDKEYGFKYGFLLEKIVIFATKLMESKSIKNYFYSDVKCTGCGVCEKICLSKRINLIDGIPRWKDEILCFMCYACLNYCPQKSVQINSKWYMKSFTMVQERYTHPYATAQEIEEQKRK